MFSIRHVSETDRMPVSVKAFFQMTLFKCDMTKMEINVTKLLCFWWIFKCAGAFPDGAPSEACLTMFPEHGPQRQLAPCPFMMTPNASRYSPSDVIHLDISSTTPGRYIKGIIIRTRPKDGDTERIVGQFTDWPSNKTHAFDCLGGQKNIVTHSNNIPVSSIQLGWIAPNTSVGDIEFVISFVENYDTFWVNQIFELPATVIISAPTTEELSPVFEIIDWSECGESKGCFLYPRTCTGHDCYVAVTYKVVNSSVEFEMFGSQQGYVAVGFSHDSKMGDDETIACTTDGNGNAIQRGYNHEGLYNERQLKDGLSHIQGTYRDGRLFCRFMRPLSMFVYTGDGHRSRKYYNLMEDYYLMLAWGEIYDGTEVLSIHVELPVITQRKVSFHDNAIVRGSSLPLTKQIHGALMLVAWMWFVGIGTIISRHFKNGFKNRIICGSKVWFQIHRFIMILGWLLTVASFVLIFVVLGKLREIHSYLGITVMAASTLQVLAGILRPKPESSVRNIFNWGHWFLGKSAHIVAGVAFFFAFNIDMIPQPQTNFANIVLGVYVGLQVCWEVWFEIDKKLSKKRDKERYELNNMSKSKGTVNGKRENDDSYLTQWKTRHSPDKSLALYMICIMTVTAAALASVFLF